MTCHPIQRAWERYGLRLGRDELNEIARRATPANRMRRMIEADVHVIPWREQTLIVAVREIAPGETIVATFLPHDYFASGRNDRFLMATTGRPKHKRAGRGAIKTRRWERAQGAYDAEY